MPTGRRRGLRVQRQRTSWMGVALVVVIFVAIAGALVGLNIYRQGEMKADPNAFVYTPPPDPVPTETPAPIRKTLSSVASRLNDKTRPFSIVIFGDSTGISRFGWQVLVPQWIAQKYGRPATLHPWDRDALKYDASWQLATTGTNAPITVWNGSAPGRDVSFARANQEAMIPVNPSTVDVVFMNFGHTETADSAVDDIGSFMDDAAKKYPNAAIVYLKQNPDYSKSPLVKVQAANVAAMEIWSRQHRFESIPVYDAFEATGGVDDLVDHPTLIHPNAAGYRIWADTTIDRLKTDGF
jgi:hypothetical protein